MQRLIRKFLRKIHLRLLLVSVGLAAASWYIGLNFADPMTFENFYLELVLINENALTDNRRLIENQRELENVMVNVQVRGLLSELESLVRDQTIFAYIDLNSSELVHVPVSRLRDPIPVRIGVGFLGNAQYNSIHITNVSPQMTNIVMDRIESRNLAIMVDFDGYLPDGYVKLAHTLDPGSVMVSGPSSAVSRIERLAILVDLDEARTDIEGEQEILAFNAFGEGVTGFDIAVETVKYRVPVFRTSTVQILMGEEPYYGGPAAGVAVTDILWEPRTIEIKGHVDEVDLVGQIVLDPVTIGNIVETTQFYYYMDEYLTRINEERGFNVTLLNPAQNRIYVTFVTERIVERDFVIPIDMVHFIGEGALDNRLRTTLSESVTVTLKGTESLIDEILLEDIVCLVDTAPLADVRDGEHTLAVTVTPPDNTTLSTPPPTITISVLTIDNDN